DYEIKIRTTAEGDGAQKTADGLKQLSSAAASASTASSDLSTELQQQIAASKLSAAAVETQETSIKKLVVGFKQLGHEIPLVGVALHALKNPWTLLAAA